MGFVSPHLASLKPGPLNHSRWLATACRIVRFYVSTSQPSPALIDLVQYIMSAYVPVWFQIKSNSNLANGARHFFTLLNCSQSMTQRVRDVVNRVLQRNEFFAHPENILISILMNEQEHVRELAWRRVLKCRSSSPLERRKFVVPKVLFDAEHYYEMIDWQATTISKPPVTRCLSNTTIQSYVKSRVLPSGLFPMFPCHTQAVERAENLLLRLRLVL